MMDHPGIVILECVRQGEVCLSKHLQWWLFVSRKQPLMDFEAKTLSSEHQDSIKLNYLLLIDSYLWTVVKVWWRWKQVCLVALEEKDMRVNFSSNSSTQVKSHEYDFKGAVIDTLLLLPGVNSVFLVYFPSCCQRLFANRTSDREYPNIAILVTTAVAKTTKIRYVSKTHKYTEKYLLHCP